MVLSQDIFDRDFTNIRDDLTEEAIFAGDTFTVNRTNIRKELQNRDRDFIENYQLTLIFRTRDFTEATPVKALPTSGKTLVFDGRTYRVITTDDSPDGVSFRVHLQAEFTGNVT